MITISMSIVPMVGKARVGLDVYNVYLHVDQNPNTKPLIIVCIEMNTGECKPYINKWYYKRDGIWYRARPCDDYKSRYISLILGLNPTDTQVDDLTVDSLVGQYIRKEMA